MDEKVIIESVVCKKKKIIMFVLIPLIVGILLLFIGELSNKFRLAILYDDLDEIYNWSENTRDFLYESSWRLTIFCYWTSIIPGVIFIFNLIVSIVRMINIKIVVTNTRVYGSIRNIQLDLPIDSISAVSSYNFLMFKGLSVSTSSGTIKFLGLENRDDIHKEINGLLLERQNNKTETPSVKFDSTADELKKFKELLDNGVITQEEFDAKKKQLLGL